MKMRRTFIYLLLIIALPAILPTRALPEELDFINRPMNATGLTGLLTTTSPFSLDPGVVEMGIASFSEDSKRPDYTLSEYAVLISVGTGKGTELAIRGCSFSEKSPPAASETGAGDVEMSFKWNFLKINPDAPAVPAVAMIITGIAPTGDKETGMNRVQHWGARFGLSSGTDISWREHVVGIYADAQMGIQDLSDDRYRDRYQAFHAGMLLPISKYRNLQVFIEYTAVSGKDVINNIDGSDYTAFMYGLRLVSERINLTVGTQFLRKNMEDTDNPERIISMLSVKF